jgi:hypothetical protein
MNTIRFVSLACAAVAGLAGTAWAQPHEGDVALYIENSTIHTGVYDGGVYSQARFFAATLGVVAPNFTADPGFDCSPGTFPAGSRNGFDILGPLEVWTASAFEPAAAARMNISFATLSVDTPETAQVVTGFTLSVGSNGQWHRHLDYTLSNSAPDGVYLLKLEIFSTSASLARSEPFWILFNQNATEQAMSDAAAWVQLNYIAPAPCPADFNQDGGVDGSDVESFFLAWESGDPVADVNLDGGVDGSDIETFFVAWQNGGC